MDDSPLLPSQVKDASLEPKKPTPWWMKMFKVLLYYFGIFGFLATFQPWFRGDTCPQMQPIATIIAFLLFSILIFASLFTMIHNCKTKTFCDPEPLSAAKVEKYKGQNVFANIKLVIDLANLPVGIWALVYGLQNQDLRGVEQCDEYVTCLIVMGCIVLGIFGLLIVAGIGYAIYLKVKGNNESNE